MVSALVCAGVCDGVVFHLASDVFISQPVAFRNLETLIIVQNTPTLPYLPALPPVPQSPVLLLALSGAVPGHYTTGTVLQLPTGGCFTPTAAITIVMRQHIDQFSPIFRLYVELAVDGDQNPAQFSDVDAVLLVPVFPIPQSTSVTAVVGYAAV